jgi:hypothetical protein
LTECRRRLVGLSRILRELRTCLRQLIARGHLERGRPTRATSPWQQRPADSAGIGNALLSFLLGGSCRLRRKLKDRCFLTVAKHGQQDDAPIWEFERVVMRSRLLLVDLSKDCDCLTNGQFSSSGCGRYLLGERKLCSRKKADGRRRIFGCGEPARAGPEISSCKLVADLCGARPSGLQLKSHMPSTPPLRPPAGRYQITYISQGEA